MAEMSATAQSNVMEFDVLLAGFQKTEPQLGIRQKSRAEIRRARAARNRSSARRSRLRKKEENERDLQKAKDVQSRNEWLKLRVRQLRETVLRLHKQALDLGAHNDFALLEWDEAHCVQEAALQLGVACAEGDFLHDHSFVPLKDG